MENLALLLVDTNSGDTYGWILEGIVAFIGLVVLFFMWCAHYTWWSDRRERKQAEASGRPVKSFEEKFLEAKGIEETAFGVVIYLTGERSLDSHGNETAMERTGYGGDI